MAYGEVKAYLARHTDVTELTDGRDARVAVCPAWQGRVMTSSCRGEKGLSFGFVNEDFINRGQPDPKFNNYGGEERLWLSPEGGQYGLWFKQGEQQETATWCMPKVFNEGGWDVVEATEQSIRMAVSTELQNASNAKFRLELDREVRLLGVEEVGKLLGARAAAVIDESNIKIVGYETINRVTNRGEHMTMKKGLVSIWILDMLNSSPQTVVIAPYKAGPEAKLGPVVKSDYFGVTPPDRLKVLPEAVLFLGDAHYRSKIGVSQRRARNILGSIDFQSDALTLLHFTMPDAPDEHLYLQNMFGGPHPEPYSGDVINSYNDGPSAFGEKGLGPFYELETLSPAKALVAGQSLTHRNRTLHFQADLPTLRALAKETLAVDLTTVREEMFG